jgi:hypothetical protein
MSLALLKHYTKRKNGIANFLPCTHLEVNSLNLGHSINEVMFKKIIVYLLLNTASFD